jgi:DNA ligase-4
MIEVDDVLHELASQCNFSAQSITKVPPQSSEPTVKLLADIFNRVSPAEGKWLVRLILKDFSPVCVDEALVLGSFHFLLPDLLLFQNELGAAVRLLKTSLIGYPETCDRRSENLHRLTAREKLKPIVGIKVGRPEWSKARSIDHCMKMACGQRWVLERKYDGEFCEIHIDLDRAQEVSTCIKIFSKSGKESTEDRGSLHETLVSCLRLGKPNCKIKRQAILLGELVVYSDTERRVLCFEHIRKHVLRSGKSIGTDNDSLPKEDEHLAIVFFDLLLLDDEPILNKPIDERRMWLRELYTKIAGRAMSAEWKVVDFSNAPRAKKLLVNQFAASIAERCEGLILKPCGAPYFDLNSRAHGRGQSFIKLKKDYIAGLGDEAEFAVVGASYNAQQASKCGLTNVQWTDFHLGCLTNKADVLRFDVRPIFKIVRTIQQDYCIPKPILQAANEVGKFSAKPYDHATWSATMTYDLDTQSNIPRMDSVFGTPFVFEVLGSGYEKPSNCSFFMLRHARVKKLHSDRSWKDCVSFQELQNLAASARAAPTDSESQETIRWIERLERKCRVKFERQRTKTPSTVRTATSRRSAEGRSDAEMAGDTTLVSVEADGVDGTTLVNSSPKRKRPSEDSKETSCPNNKRRCVERPRSSRQRDSKTPLADITNTANAPSSSPAGCDQSCKAIIVPTVETTARVHALKKPRAAQLKDLALKFPPTPSLSDEPQPHPVCDPLTCPFSNSVVYLSPSVAVDRHITQQLLPLHADVVVVQRLEYWDRECQFTSKANRLSSRRRSREWIVASDTDSGPEEFDLPPEVVGESQAYEGQRKIVLVDEGREREMREVLQRVKRLKERGCFGDGGGVAVWDWRVLERWQKCLSENGKLDVLEKGEQGLLVAL